MANEHAIRLGSIATIIMGQSPPSSAVVDGDNGVPFLQGCADFGKQYPQPHCSCLRPPKTCKRGDVLISVRAPVGSVNKADRDYCIGRGLAAVRLPEDYPENYGWHLLGYWSPWLHRVSQGTTFEAVGRDDLTNLEILNIQPKKRLELASVLDIADEAITKTEALIEKLKAVKQGLLHDLLTRGLDENGKLRDPKANPEQFKDSALGKVPISWEIERCEDVCSEIVVGIVIRPAQYYRPMGIPVLRSANIREDGLVSSDLVYMSEEANKLLSKSQIHEGDVLTVRTGYPGTCCIVPPEFNGANCVDLLISRPKEGILSEYVNLWINCDLGKSQVLRKQGGLAQQHFNVGELKSLLIAKPGLAEQERIVDICEAHSARIKAEQQYLNKLRLQKKGLMQDLLTGKVRVKV